jgi:hypothetical protein
MHALQVLPLLLIVMELASRRITVLRDGVVRARLISLAAIGYAAVVALVTWQALRGQSIVHPDLLTMLSFGAIVAAVGVPAAVVLSRAARTVGTMAAVPR